MTPSASTPAWRRNALRIASFDVDGRRARDDELDVVHHREDAEHVAGDQLGLVALELPARGPRQRDDAVGHLRVDGVRDQAVEHQRLQDRAADVRVVAPVGVEQLDVQQVEHVGHAVHAPRDGLRLALLAVRADGPAQRDAALVVDRHRDGGAVDPGIPEQLVGDVEPQVVWGHRDSFDRVDPVGPPCDAAAESPNGPSGAGHRHEF
ncbi:MAG TPA: hypothetical protein VI318_07485 [Baekduia sp.]